MSSASLPVRADNSGNEPVNVPGFGLPLDWSPSGNTYDGGQFNHGANDFRPNRMTAHEVMMLRFMDAVTDKPDWNLKVHDEGIVAKWQAESTSNPSNAISAKAFQWCIDELRDRATAFEKDGLIRTLEGGARVVKSDTVIDENLRNELRKAIEPLLAGSDKDWHPNSNEQVLNLVHPSLFPVVYGKTRVLKKGQVELENCASVCGQGQIALENQQIPARGQFSSDSPITFWSRRFQWLPAEVRFKGDTGTKVEFTSYINNLPPRSNKSLYETIARVLTTAIPAWNETLIKRDQTRNNVRIQATEAEIDPPGEPEWTYEFDFRDDEEGTKGQEYLQKMRDYLKQPNNPDNDDPEDPAPPDSVFTDLPSEWEGEDKNGEQWMPDSVVRWKYSRIRKVLTPEPDNAPYEEWTQSRDSYKVNLEKKFRDKGLQVIVKLASIELTPEKPSYPGGSWHLEGMLNEHIVATAIYYFDTENCTESRLRFRQESTLDEDDMQYEQDDHDPLSKIFGTNSMREEPAVQEIGSVDTRQGRLLVFPNTLQHLVEPFSLVDKSKSGHRRMLVLWLVDPNYRILSTVNVPPQQEDWYTEYLRVGEWDRNLPAEITNEILEYAKDGTMTLEEAKELRLELMAERTSFVKEVEQRFETYNLCEH